MWWVCGRYDSGQVGKDSDVGFMEISITLVTQDDVVFNETVLFHRALKDGNTFVKQNVKFAYANTILLA